MKTKVFRLLFLLSLFQVQIVFAQEMVGENSTVTKPAFKSLLMEKFSLVATGASTPISNFKLDLDEPKATFEGVLFVGGDKYETEDCGNNQLCNIKDDLMITTKLGFGTNDDLFDLFSNDDFNKAWTIDANFSWLVNSTSFYYNSADQALVRNRINNKYKKYRIELKDKFFAYTSVVNVLEPAQDVRISTFLSGKEQKEKHDTENYYTPKHKMLIDFVKDTSSMKYQKTFLEIAKTVLKDKINLKEDFDKKYFKKEAESLKAKHKKALKVSIDSLRKVIGDNKKFEQEKTSLILKKEIELEDALDRIKTKLLYKKVLFKVEKYKDKIDIEKTYAGLQTVVSGIHNLDKDMLKFEKEVSKGVWRTKRINWVSVNPFYSGENVFWYENDISELKEEVSTSYGLRVSSNFYTYKPKPRTKVINNSETIVYNNQDKASRVCFWKVGLSIERGNNLSELTKVDYTLTDTVMSVATAEYRVEEKGKAFKGNVLNDIWITQLSLEGYYIPMSKFSKPGLYGKVNFVYSNSFQNESKLIAKSQIPLELGLVFNLPSKDQESNAITVLPHIRFRNIIEEEKFSQENEKNNFSAGVRFTVPIGLPPLVN